MATRSPIPTSSTVEPLKPFKEDTIPKLFFEAVDTKSGGDAMLYNDGGQWRGISHREVEDRVTAVAAYLDGLGVRRGDRVALLSENRPEWQITDFAVLCLGAAGVSVYATLPANQIHFILADCGAKAIFVSTREQLAKIREIRGRLPELETVVCFDDPGAEAGVVSFARALEEGRARVERSEFGSLRELAAEIGPDDLATLIYTSGTTGEPKGVMLSHLNLASNVAATHQHGVFELKRGEIGLSFLPLSHVFERMVDLYFWSCGVTIAYVDAIDKVAASLIEVKPNVAAAAPRVFEKIYAKVMSGTGIKRKLVLWAKGVGEAAVDDRLTGRKTGPVTFAEKLADKLVFSKLRARTGGSIRGFVSGSAPLAPDIARFFWAAGLPIFEGYGLTETSPVLSANRPGQTKLGTVGPPLPGTEIRISEAGEILCRGPQIMKGYYKRPDATAEMIDADGWLHTGDIGELDADGFLKITDRIKNLIVTAGGKNIAPAPIENEVAMSPYIAQVVMLGDRRAFPSLLIVPDFDHLSTWATGQGISTGDREALVRDPRVRAFLEKEAMSRLGGLARYETPKKIAIIPRDFSIESGELTPSLKVKRKVVEQHYAGEIEALYNGTP